MLLLHVYRVDRRHSHRRATFGLNPRGLLFDQRGPRFSRAVGPKADIGAVEAFDSSPRATAGVTTVRVPGTTVFADGSADFLTGSAGLDWFIFDDAEDTVTDLNHEAFINDLNFING